MNVLVTGGLGFIGSNFIKHLTRKGVRVTNVDSMSVGANQSNLSELDDNPNYRFVKGDLAEKKLAETLVVEADAVVNFAAETHVDRSIKDPEPFIHSNILGTFNLLEAERKTGRKIRHIQVSTDEVYGDITEGSYTEHSCINPSNPYSASKASADLLCKAYTRTYGMDIIITRCTNNYGPYQHPEKLIPKTIIYAHNDLKIPVYGTGEAVRDWLYVQDHCTAIETVMNKGRSGEVYNVSAGNEVTVIDVVEKILMQMGKPRSLISFVEDRRGHDMRYSLDSAKLRASLGWKPEYSFEEALKMTVEWYIVNEAWWNPLISDQTGA